MSLRIFMKGARAVMMIYAYISAEKPNKLMWIY